MRGADVTSLQSQNKKATVMSSFARISALRWPSLTSRGATIAQRFETLGRRFRKLKIRRKAAVVVGAIIFLVFVALGYPASLFSVGGLFLWLYLCRRPSREPLNTQSPRPMTSRFVRAVLDNIAELALYTAAGCGIVWLVGLCLTLMMPDPYLYADWQMHYLQAFKHYHRATTGWRALLVVGLAVLLSIGLNALWPLAYVGRASKAFSRVGMMFSGIALFTFVGVDRLSAHATDLTYAIRAQIADNLAELIRYRQNRAAYSWLTASVVQQRQLSMQRPMRDPLNTPAVGVSWYFEQAVAQCAAANQAYRQNFSAIYVIREDDVPAYCGDESLVRLISREGIVAPKPAARDVAAPLTWLPEYRGILSIGWRSQDVRKDVSAANLNIGFPTDDLVALEKLSESVGRDKERSYEAAVSAREALATALADLLPELTQEGIAGLLINTWREQIVAILVNESWAQIARRLRQPAGPARPNTAAILGIDGSTFISAPGSDQAAADAKVKIAKNLDTALKDTVRDEDAPREGDDPIRAAGIAGVADAKEAIRTGVIRRPDRIDPEPRPIRPVRVDPRFG